MMSSVWRPVCRRFSFTRSYSFSSNSCLQGSNLEREQYWVKKLQQKMEKQQIQETKRELRQPVKKPNPSSNKPLRGRPRDQEEVRISKTMSWILRHGAKSEGLYMRQDGYVRVQDLLALPRMKTVDRTILERLVQSDAKNRYHMYSEPPAEPNGASEDVWWIRANQGHSMKDIELELVEITNPMQVPMAVHGTNLSAWPIIEKEGLSPMKRTHIHMAQTTDKAKGANPGMRGSSQILIYIDLEKALRGGIKFYLSDNGVVLSKGDENGHLRPEFFKKVTRLDGTPLPGWAGDESESQQPLTVRIEQNEQNELRDSKESSGIDESINDNHTTEAIRNFNIKD